MEALALLLGIGEVKGRAGDDVVYVPCHRTTNLVDPIVLPAHTGLPEGFEVGRQLLRGAADYSPKGFRCASLQFAASINAVPQRVLKGASDALGWGRRMFRPILPRGLSTLLPVGLSPTSAPVFSARSSVGSFGVCFALLRVGSAPTPLVVSALFERSFRLRGLRSFDSALPTMRTKDPSPTGVYSTRKAFKGLAEATTATYLRLRGSIHRISVYTLAT